MGNWEGKNIAGKLLCRVRNVLKLKLEEGLTLNKLKFNYSLPSLRADQSSKHWDLFLGHIQPKARDTQVQHTEAVGCKDPTRISFMSIGEEAATVLPNEPQTNLEEDKELSHELDALGKGDDSDLSLFTLCDRAVRRKSHSIENKAGGIKQRNNPPRQPDSLTRRERVFIKKPEEINCDDMLASKKGFERSYGTTGYIPKTSTPAEYTSSDNYIGRAQRFLLDYLDLDINTKAVQAGLRPKKKRPDTPMPQVQNT